MKIVISRKGFDSEAGGCASPILPDSRMISLPIPATRGIPYDEILRDGVPLSSFVTSLSHRAGSSLAHLDPDLDDGARHRLPGWLPAFGQTDAAQTHLARHALGSGDLFLFFGWFKEAEEAHGGWRFRRGAPNRHVLFGWLQVGEVISLPEGPDATISKMPWLAEHPHLGFGPDPRNTVYIAAEKLSLPGLGPLKAAGAGLFRTLRPELVLTAEGQPKRSLWSVPSWMAPASGRPPLSHHENLGRWKALLESGSVVGAARRLRLSPSAMSRALARLRAVTGDPLLVRAGRGLVLTPRAVALRADVGHLVQAAEAALRPAKNLDLQHLVRTFTLRTSDGFVETFGPTLVAKMTADAPGVTLCFMPKPDKDSAPLRDGDVDLETGVIGTAMGPEVRTQALFRDIFIGAARPGHPLCDADLTPDRYATANHVAVRRHRQESSPVDRALAACGLERRIVTVVGGYSAALALARTCDLIATVPLRHTAGLRTGLYSFALPVTLPQVTISLFWHPRMDADPAHSWLRHRVREACADVFPSPMDSPALKAFPGIALQPS